MSAEYLDIVSEYGEPTGETVLREDAHALGLRHRTAHIWILRKSGAGTQVLLQKRSRNKDSYPSEYDTSSAGHVTAGDTPLHGAVRELYEELGIRADSSDLTLIGTFANSYEEVFHDRIFRDNEICFVYIYAKEPDLSSLRLQEEEIEEVRWFDLRQVRQACRLTQRMIGNDRICVPSGSIEMLAHYLEE